MIISKPQVQDACRGPITYPKIKILRVSGNFRHACGSAGLKFKCVTFPPNAEHKAGMY